MYKKMKRIVTWAIVVCLGIIGFSLAGAKNAKASDGVEVKNYKDIRLYRGDTYTAPEMEGYVFSGWYTSKDYSTPLGEDVKEGGAWAKFVPAAVMDVKAQITANLIDSDAGNDGSAGIRFVTTVDSLRYREIGFKLTVAGRDQVTRASNKVYDQMYAIGEKDGEVMKYTPKDFCPLSMYFKSWAYTNVQTSDYETQITATSFWVTLDGTTVEGSTKIATIQDGINSYFSTEPDTSWFDPEKTEFTITTPQQLYGIAELAKNGQTFEKKTINLDADITLNVGDAREWETTPPADAHQWTPIQAFNGTFNGHDHTISGLYVNDSENGKVGLFQLTRPTATITNLKLTNGYFYSTKQYVAAVAAQGSGKFSNIYVDLILKNGTGGWVGGILSQASGETTIENCWSNCEITTDYRDIGGFVADGSSYTVTIKHCLNTGDLTISEKSTEKYAYAGGIIGKAGTGNGSSNPFSGNFLIEDCLNVGTVSAKTGTITDSIGGVTGCTTGDTPEGRHTVTVRNTYCIDSANKILFGTGSKTPANEACAMLTSAKLTGAEAFYNTTLDFEGYWAARDGKTPVLKAFVTAADQVVDLTGAVRGTTSWYDGKQSPYTISTVEDLYGLARLTNHNGVTFENKVVQLGENITVNEDVDLEAWGRQEAPKNQWTPITNFAGTFDGQGHTISGLYGVGRGEDLMGLFTNTKPTTTIQNLKITDSYFCSEQGYVGGVIAYGLGTVSGVYVKADVVRSQEHKNGTGKGTGGIIGYCAGITDTTKTNEKGEHLTVTNCWSDCNITTYAHYAGGIVGNAMANHDNMKVSISHCLFTGKLSLHATGTKSQEGHGGIVGKTGNGKDQGKFLIDDCLNVGTLEKEETKGLKLTAVGGIVGTVGTAGNKGTTITNSYWINQDGSMFANAVGGEKSDSVINPQHPATPYADLLGDAAKTNTELSFYDLVSNPGGYWVTVDGKPPVLRSFSDQ